MYRFLSFGGVTLPIYNRQENHDGGTVDSSIVKTINGSFDPLGAKRAVPISAIFSMRAIIADELTTGADPVYWITGEGDQIVIGGGDTFVFEVGSGSSGETIRDQLDELRALIGAVGTLIRQPKTGGDGNQSITARLLAVRQQKTTELYAEIDVTFEAVYPYWHGASKSANRVSTTISATNGGNAPVRDATLTVTGSATSVTVTGTGINFTWTGSISGGQQLVISGNSVTANGSPSKVTINSGHTRDVLIELESGANTLTVTGGASASLSWYDTWQ